MTWNNQTFKTRTLTAIVFAAVMLAGLLLNGYLFIALILLIMGGCLVELNALKKKMPETSSLKEVLHAAVYIVIPLLMYMSLGFPSLMYFTLGFSNESLEDLRYFDPVFPTLIIASIWINDTMAYIVGSLIGKTPFSPISPKKTWEGTIGGAVLCVAAMTIFASFYTKMIYWQDMLFISVLCAVFGTLGDLYESKLKRIAGVKDSGNLLPGHGGMLDRFDSLIFAAPPVWLYVYLYMK